MAMSNLKGLAIQFSAASGIQHLIAYPLETSLSTLLFHKFFFDGESKNKGRERLKRQLEWICREYAPLSLAGATSALATGKLPKFPLLITVDDAKTDLLDVHEVFRTFEVPVAVFVCVGWTSQADEIEQESLLARIIAAIEWYQGPDTLLLLGNGRTTVQIGRAHKTKTIEHLLRSPDEYSSHLEELAVRLDRLNIKNGGRVCTWRELADLHRDGAQFGCHSVSHIRLTSACGLRLAFEIRESKRLVETKLDAASVFAYPFGIDGTFSKETTAELISAGFKFAFLTHPDFANATSDPFHLPRFALPDRDMSLAEFRARVRGGGIALRRIKQLMRHVRP